MPVKKYGVFVMEALDRAPLNNEAAPHVGGGGGEHPLAAAYPWALARECQLTCDARATMRAATRADIRRLHTVMCPQSPPQESDLLGHAEHRDK